MQEPIRKIIFKGPEIQNAVERVAHLIALWLRSTSVPSLEIVSVLEGAKPFTRDLVQALRSEKPLLALKVHEVKVTGTDGVHLLDGRQWAQEGLSGGEFQGRVVLLADDLVDSGKTLAGLKVVLQSWGVKEVRTAVLVRKYGEESGPVDFCGFDLDLDRPEMGRQGIKDYWLFGYGMDEGGRFRDLDHIGWTEVR